jgi:hypothetical protein
MTINLLQTPEYKAMIHKHIIDNIDYLLSQNQPFSIACESKHITFTPELPLSITEAFKESVLFIVMNYSLETALLDEEYFSFEAGFGSENIGATVHIPILAIKQILLGDHPLLFNLSKYEKAPKKPKVDSMELLLKNPKNKNLLKKRTPKPS